MQLWKVTGKRNGKLFDIFVTAGTDSYEARRIATFEHGLCVLNVEPA